MTALALFDLLKPNYALATQVEFTDPEIVAEYITYPRQMVTARYGVIW